MGDEHGNSDDHDVEVFERIPWEALEPPPDRRWMAYVVAAAIVLGAVGFSVGRQLTPPAQPTVASRQPATTQPQSSVPPATVTSSTTDTTDPAGADTGQMWSEADLMALPVDSVEAGAAALSEWYLIEHFTRDEPEGSRSFVEWVEAWEMEWLDPALVDVTVLMRRLAAPPGQPYMRLETEAWSVIARLDDTGWAVAAGPFAADAPALEADLIDGELSVSGSAPVAIETVAWTDPAGLEWSIQRRVP